MAEGGLEIMDVCVHAAPGLSDHRPTMMVVHGFGVFFEAARNAEAVVCQCLIYSTAAERVCESNGLIRSAVNIYEELHCILSLTELVKPQS